MGNSDSKPPLPPTQISAATLTRGIPKCIRFSYNKMLTLKLIIHLAEPDAEPDAAPCYVMNFPRAFFGGMVLHDGPTFDHAALATMSKTGRGGWDFAIDLPPIESQGVPARQEILRHNGGFNKETYWFAMQVGGGRLEKFVWRHTRGDDVKSIGMAGSGWKLVRLRPGSSHQDADEAAHRADDGFTKDGKEIVAIFADANFFGDVKLLGELRFLGAGLTGELGMHWALMTVMTCMCVWMREKQQQSSH